MEFAITVPEQSGTDDSWLPCGARSFLFEAAAAENNSSVRAACLSRRATCWDRSEQTCA